MDSVNDPVKQRVRDRKEVAVAKLAKVPRHQGLKLEGKRIVLLLQGGGALGAYHVGAFEALANECRKAENNIDWVAGISIGAINSAVIAAPKSGDAVRELELLWDELLWPEYPPFDYTGLMRAWLPWPWLRGASRNLTPT